MPRLAAIILAVLMTAATLPAAADTSLHVRQGPLSYRIIDLTPGDSSAASVTFLPTLPVTPDYLRDPAGAIDLMVLRGHDSEYYAVTGQGKEPMTAAANASPQSWAQATVGNRESPWSETVAIDAGSRYNGNVGGASIDVWSSQIYFELAPNTAIEFASDSRIQASVNSPVGTNEWIQGATNLAIGSVPYDWNNIVSGMEWIDLSPWPWQQPAIDISSTLTGRYENHGGSTAYGYAYLASSFRAISGIPTPVPEPAAWMLLAAGLALLGAAIRRRA